jgi:hypothetical protein
MAVICPGCLSEASGRRLVSHEAAVERDVATVLCGSPPLPAHKASEFDQPENTLVGAWRKNGGTGTYEFWGNTRHMKQCDGSYTWSNGYPAFMSP